MAFDVQSERKKRNGVPKITDFQASNGPQMIEKHDLLSSIKECEALRE